ncbi:hypothetical protein BJ508DRAFT_315423, partial [Ascobolus immersus RN42]
MGALRFIIVSVGRYLDGTVRFLSLCLLERLYCKEREIMLCTEQNSEGNRNELGSSRELRNKDVLATAITDLKSVEEASAVTCIDMRNSSGETAEVAVPWESNDGVEFDEEAYEGFDDDIQDPPEDWWNDVKREVYSNRKEEGERTISVEWQKDRWLLPHQKKVSNWSSSLTPDHTPQHNAKVTKPASKLTPQQQAEQSEKRRRLVSLLHDYRNRPQVPNTPHRPVGGLLSDSERESSSESSRSSSPNTDGSSHSEPEINHHQNQSKIPSNQQAEETSRNPPTSKPTPKPTSASTPPRSGPSSPPRSPPTPPPPPASPSTQETATVSEHHRRRNLAALLDSTAMAFFTSFGNFKGEMIEEMFESIETEDQLRIDQATVLGVTPETLKSIMAKSPIVKKAKLRASLKGAPLDYFNCLSPDVRMDYEKAKKALMRKYGMDNQESTEEKEERRQLQALQQMSTLKQGHMPMKEYILVLEDLAEVLKTGTLPKQL